MSPMIALGLLGLGLLLPLFGSDDDTVEETLEPAEPVDPIEPVTPEQPADPAEPVGIVTGTDGADTLTADQNQTLNAGAGADDINVDGTNAIVNAGDGADSITTGGASYGGTDDPATYVINGEEGDDTIMAFGIGGTINGGGGNDVIEVQGTQTGVFGGDGDDLIRGDTADYGGGTPLDGGAGDDHIIMTDGAGYHTQTFANGGEGNDTLTSGLISSSPSLVDVLTGGSGADVFEVAVNAPTVDPASEVPLGSLTEVTDFAPAEDALIVEIGLVPAFFGQPDAANVVSFEVNDLADGSGATLDFSVANADAGGQITGSILLSGVTGIDPDTVDFGIRLVDVSNP